MNINDCDLNNDCFHFTNKRNIESILRNGLLVKCGTASTIIGDRPNVSVTHGFKGVAGVINSFIFTFAEKITPATMPEEYKQYFKEITDYTSTEPISKEEAYLGMARKLKDEVFIRVELTQEDVDSARIGGFTGFDINMTTPISADKVDVVTDEYGQPISAYDFAKIIYEDTKGYDAMWYFHEDFYRMFEKCEELNIFGENGEETP